MRIHFKTVKTIPIAVLSFAILAGCGRQERTTSPPSVSLHEAAVEGNLGAVQQHIAAGSDLNERELEGGSTPLITAAVFGKTEAARALIEAGADVNLRNNEGSTALISAAFLCRTEIVELLLANGADKGVMNNSGATALDSVASPFDSVKGVYDFLGATLGPVGLQLDYERIKVTRPKIAEMLR